MAITLSPEIDTYYGSAQPSGGWRLWKHKEASFNPSVFVANKARFHEARLRLRASCSLEGDWDGYGSESPNLQARQGASEILRQLEASNLPPTRLMPSAEGGIGIVFVEGDRRAELEIYNSGEIVAATYTSHGDPVVWEISIGQSLEGTIDKIREHLSTQAA